MKKLTVRQQVMRFAGKHPEGFTAAQAREVIKTDSKRLYVVLWQMKKAGVLKHDEAAHTYALTGVNKETKPVFVQPPEAQQIKYASKHELEAERWRSSYEELSARATKLNVQYEDALAVVRYLEDKLFKAIQHDVRRGSNT